jgi:hypothetical protein
MVFDDIISFSWKHEVHPLLSYIHILDFNFVECFRFSTCLLFAYLFLKKIKNVLCIRNIMFYHLKKLFLRESKWKEETQDIFH